MIILLKKRQNPNGITNKSDKRFVLRLFTWQPPREEKIERAWIRTTT